PADLVVRAIDGKVAHRGNLHGLPRRSPEPVVAILRPYLSRAGGGGAAADAAGGSVVHERGRAVLVDLGAHPAQAIEGARGEPVAADAPHEAIHLGAEGVVDGW